MVSKTEHTPDDNLRLLPMSKKAEVYKKELEVKDPLVEKIAEIGGQDFEYVTLLQHVENRTDYKDLPDELKLIRNSLPHQAIVELDTGARLVVRDVTVILIPRAARQEIIKILHLTHTATDTMMLQTKNRLFWPKMCAELDPRSQMK